MDEYLWPARNVAEHAYCPRLFYLMEVEGLHLPSADTLEGKRTHRRVDKVSAVKSKKKAEEAPRSEEEPDEVPDGESDDESRPRAVRSLVLTSDRLKLTATLDLAEIEGKRAVPVEYRKGRPQHVTLAPPPDDPGEAEEQPLTRVEPWPTDRVQIGLQVILLEDAGYEVPEAVLYYATEKRRLPIPVTEELRVEALATLKAAQACAEGSRPSPLVNDRRCIGCSLQPICLPDEVNQQRGDPGDEALTPRKVWPPRDDGIHVVTLKDGVRVGVRGHSLQITDREGGAKREIPLVGAESLTLVGNVQLSTQALQVLADRNVPVAWLSGAGRLIAMIDPVDSVSARIRQEQIRGLDREERRIELTRALIAAKIANQRKLLQRNIEGIESRLLDDLGTFSEKASTGESLESIRGYEGQAAHLYFGNFARMIKDVDAAGRFDENGRRRRPPPDPVNASLSLGYSMLSKECAAALRVAGLEPSVGAFHVPRPGRPAFALDLMEPFRPLIADSVTVAAFNRGEFRPGHFLETAAGCTFTDHGRRAFFNSWGRRMDTAVTHPVFDYRLSYRRMIVLHARMIAAWLLGEVPALSFLTTR